VKKFFEKQKAQIEEKETQKKEESKKQADE
jgi:hypothetical protein